MQHLRAAEGDPGSWQSPSPSPSQPPPGVHGVPDEPPACGASHAAAPSRPAQLPARGWARQAASRGVPLATARGSCSREAPLAPQAWALPPPAQATSRSCSPVTFCKLPPCQQLPLWRRQPGKAVQPPPPQPGCSHACTKQRPPPF